MFIIYQITNTLNRHSYIGFTSQKLSRRWSGHKCSANKGYKGILYRAMRKYGMENFSIEVLEEGWCKEIGLSIREPYWISVLKPEYNITGGGEGTLGMVHSQKTKDKMSRSALNNPKGMEHIRKLGHEYANKNRKPLSKDVLDSLRVRFLGKPSKKLTCPHCNLVGGIGPMRKWHFDSCKFKDSLLTNEILQLRKDGYTHAQIFEKIDRRVGYCKVGRILRSHGAAFTVFATCPHCNKTGGARGMTRWHFDNCKYKNAGTLPL